MDNNDDDNNRGLFTNIEANLQEVISNSIRNYFITMPQTNRVNQSINQVNNSNEITGIIRENMNISNNNMRLYNNNMRLYNDNIRDYNINIREMTRVLQTMHISNSNIRHHRMHNPTVSSVHPSARFNRREYQSTRHSNTLNTPPFNLFENLFNNNVPYTFNDVVIRPTSTQIENACELFEYTSSIPLINNRCPITLTDFYEGEQIRRIHHCGHTFSADAIINWFRENVVCPICRYDIRDYESNNNENTTNNDENTTNNDENTTNNDENTTNNDESLHSPIYTGSITITEPFIVDVSMTTITEPFNVDSSMNITQPDSLMNSVENIIMAALNIDSSNNELLSSLLRNTNISNANPHPPLFIPLEYYDASNNFLGNNTNNFS
jgi:hypothetical protein